MTELAALKPILTALLLPPVPWLLLILVGLRSMARRPRLGHAAIVVGVLLIWLSACEGPARWLHGQLGLDQPPLDAAQIAALRADKAAASTAILVLGGGMAARFNDPHRGELNGHSLERLRLGIRLARQTGWPVAFSGGRGWAQRGGIEDSEAEAAQRTATEDFGHPLRWLEGESRDTAENAARSVALLRAEGVTRVLLVTHAWHMPRAMMWFADAAGNAGPSPIAAPLSIGGAVHAPWLEWLPSAKGFEWVRAGLREWLGIQLARVSSDRRARQEAAP